MQRTILRPADLIFTRSSRPLGKLIRWFTRGRGESKTYTNHVAGIGLNQNVVEALTTVKSTHFDSWIKENKVFEVWRHTGLKSETRDKIAKYAEDQLGHKYGYPKIALHAMDGLISKITGGSPYVFRRLAFMGNYPICSWVWSFAYHKTGIEFGSSYGKACPDDMHDYVSNSKKWELILKRR